MNSLSRASCLIFLVTECAFSQEGTSGYPFDVPADPRSFAMGESFTALPSNPSALIYNPAGLAGLTGLCVSYSQRALATSNEETLRSLNAALATSIGSFAAQYNRDSYNIPTVIEGASGPPVMDSYGYDIAIGYAVALGAGFSAGLAAKYYEDVGTGSTFSTTPARLLDFGFTYTFRRFHSQATVEDSLTIGMSYQNIGSGGNTHYAGAHIPELDSREIPQYFRAGLSYALRVVPRREGDVSPLEAVLSGDYRSGQAAGSRDVGGLGVECTIEEFISVRAGGVFMEGERDTHIRYGLGVRLPFRALGVDLLVGYALIPWSDLSAFSIELVRP